MRTPFVVTSQAGAREAPCASNADALDSRLRGSDSPRLGFLGLGWIGQHRMQALLDAQACQVVAVADPAPEVQARVRELAPGAAAAGSLDELLAHDLDGVVIATPSAQHARQCLRVLERRIAVFCQKPLARTAEETRSILQAAKQADRLLGCDLSYRHTEAMRRIRHCVVEGELGAIHAIDLVFHNAYGPNKGWARDPRLSGGGCAIDLGTHLVDMAFWLLGPQPLRNVQAALYAKGRRLAPGDGEVEDFALAQFELGDTAVRLACSWEFSGGTDAVIEVHVHGSRGGAAMRNRNGSFFDFVAERYEGTRRTVLAEPPDAWGGRAVVDWARRLAGGTRYSDGIASLVQVAQVLDAVYGR